MAHSALQDNSTEATDSRVGELRCNWFLCKTDDDANYAAMSINRLRSQHRLMSVVQFVSSRRRRLMPCLTSCSHQPVSWTFTADIQCRRHLALWLAAVSRTKSTLHANLNWLSLTHSLTAVLDQLRVVASSTSNDPGPRSRQHQQIGQRLLPQFLT